VKIAMMRQRWTGLAATGALIVMGSVVVSAGVHAAVAHTRGGGSVEEETSLADNAGDILESEIETMLANGTPASHTKVQRLQQDLNVLRNGVQTPMPGEPGLDLSSTLGASRGSGIRSVALDDHGGVANTEPVAWDRGEVVCEPVPPEALDVTELAGAICLSAPQPDGSSRYVAVAPDGTVRVVRFEINGNVEREPDISVNLVGRALSEVDMLVNLLGQVVVTVSGASEPIATIDLG
jgi:hypothetical protein